MPDPPPAVAGKQALPAVPAESAPPASPRVDPVKAQELPKLISRYFDGHVGRRFYIQVDKPLYQPGETIWFRAWDLGARSLAMSDATQATLELVSPKGATVISALQRGASNSATPKAVAGALQSCR